MGVVELENLGPWTAQALGAGRVAHSARQRFEAVATLLERIADLVAVAAALLLAYWSYDILNLGKRIHYPAIAVVELAFAFAVMFVFLLDRDGAYARASSLLRIRETERILRVSVTAFGLVFPATFFAGLLFSRWAFALALIFVPIVLAGEKQLLYAFIRHLHSRGHGRQNVLLYGASFTGHRVFSALVRSPKLGLNPVAVLDDALDLAGQKLFESGYRRKYSATVMAGPLTSDLLQKQGVSMVIVAIPSLSRERLEEVASIAAAANATMAFVPHLSEGGDMQTDYADIDGLLIASLTPSILRPWYETAKRAFDCLSALVLLIITAPMWAAAAVLIRTDSEGPVFFRQTRVGREGQVFTIYKFRSMRITAPTYDFHPKSAGDSRVTKVGRWLRRTSLDELPQLINVLKGDMSLVGPRPEMPFIVNEYGARHRQRLRVKPGITGLWQLSADRAFLIHENIQYDLYYIRHRNFFMDLAVLMHTVVFVMKGM